MGLSNITEFYAFNKKPVSVKLQDRDVMCFHSDFLVDDISYANEDGQDQDLTVRYCNESNIGLVAYTSDTKENMACKNRYALQYTRVTSPNIDGSYVANGKRLVFFKSKTAGAILPFYEVHQPSITYNANANLLTMFFWTSFKKEWDGIEYDHTQIYSQFDHESKEWKQDVDDEVSRVLCVAVGSIQKFIVRGGGIVYSSSDSGIPELVPFFEYPQIVQPWVYWSDIPPYPNDDNSVNYERSPDGQYDLLKGMPLVFNKGDATGLNNSGDKLILFSPLDQTSKRFDAFPYFYVHQEVTTPEQQEGQPPPITSGLAIYPEGQFFGLVDSSLNYGMSLTVGEPVGVLVGESDAFVRGVYGARVVAIYGTDEFGYIKTLLVRDHVPPLIEATSNGTLTQTVQVISSDQDLDQDPTGQDFTVYVAPE